MTPQRVGVKWYCEAGASVDSKALIPVFHQWIRDKRLEGLLIDVADYSHVPDGPGVMLIGHEADCGLDEGVGGSLGMLAVRKRIATGSLADAVTQTGRLAATAASALAAESLGVNFSSAKCHVLIFDRLSYPNDDSNIQEVAQQVASALADWTGAETSAAVVSDDPREPAAFDVTLTAAPSIAELADRSGAAAG